MAPKGKRSAHSAQKPEEEHDEPLQAVVLADSYETRFAPFSTQVPRASCLLPLVNTPLIEYTFQFLAHSGVDEVYFVCGNQTDEIESYLDQSKWTSRTSPFSHLELVRSQARSIGEVMRDLDKRAILKNDFLVVYGDIVSNISLDVALSAHKKRRAANKNAIMTMVLRENRAGPETRIYAPWFVVDPRLDRCLHYEYMSPENDDQFLRIDPEILKEHDEICHRSDLIDCGIDICTPEVLALWTDNFDFQTPRGNFLHAVLKDYELHGKTIHTHIETRDYAKRVLSVKEYAQVSKDIITRWAYPFAPDSNLLDSQRYQMTKRFVYKETNVHLSRSCEIGPKTVIGDDTRIGEKTRISNSTIGRRCMIGNNVVIDNAYIWEDSVIKDGAVIKQSIIAGGCTIGKNCTVEPGSLVSFGVQVADGTTIKAGSQITCVKRKRDNDELIQVENDASVVGSNGVGALHTAEEDEDEDSAQKRQYDSLLCDVSQITLPDTGFSDIEADSDSDADFLHTSAAAAAAQHQHQHQRRTSTAGSVLSNASEDIDEVRANRTRDADFHSEAVANLVESLQRGDDSANVQLELTSLRMASHVSEHTLRRAIVTAFMRHISALAEGGKAIPVAVKATIAPHKVLLNRNLFDKEGEDKRDQVDLLLLLQTDLVHRDEGDAILMHVAHELVGLDVLEAEGLEQWWSDERSEAGEELKRVKAKTKQLVDFLLADEEKDDSDEEAEDSD